MVSIEKNNIFGNVSLEELMDATYTASTNFQVRAFFEAKDEILKTSKYSEKEFFEILDAMIDAETERKIVLEKLQGRDPLFLSEIADKITLFPPENVIRDVIYLMAQGYVEEHIEVKTKMVTKKIKGEEKQVEVKEYFYRYQAKELPDDFIEYYLEPVSIVFDAGVCCQCGWCSAICPVNAIMVDADNLEIDAESCMKCGLCFSVCPRSFSIDQATKAIKKLDKELNWSDNIGAYFNTYTGSTTNEDIVKVRQDGGVVTTIAEYLLKNKLVDAVIAVQHSEDLWKPEPVIIDDVKNLYKTGGTKYANSPSLKIIDQAKKYDNVAFVGVPCMMKALEKGALYPSGLPFFKNIKYRIGLFCMESFPYEQIINLTKEQFSKDIKELTKMNIGGGKFIINLKSGEQIDVPLKEVQKYARDSCHFCEDLTSDYADISVGSIGSQDGWSSVITRSKAADKLYNDIVKAGLIESKSLKEVKPGQFLVEKIGGTKRNKCKPINLKEIQNGN
ncbi:MAG: Coenzyme F420 hydrogenase/dehydrogenase, beta subunit C-terminal domain [Candidatus Lokiarchaeota archaeon]|nr:Coenzyme F420 hydrogenase/dehydrogenase, beta subunit C-terminal domain [Candidatus Lokiarchaeota archaeon]